MLHPFFIAWLAAVTPQDSAPRNLAVHVEDIEVADGLVLALTGERQNAAADLNGDGDTLDSVLTVFDAEARACSTVGLAVARPFPTVFLQRPIASEGRFVAFGVSESGQGASDLNGDGDAADDVLHLYDHASRRVVNTELAVRVLRVAVFAETEVFFLVDELSQGVDLNGDGDLRDAVAHVYELATGVVGNLRLAVREDPFSGGFDSVGDTVAFAVSEAGEARDLNGDGDVADVVAFLRRASTRETSNLGLAVHGGVSFSDGFLPPLTSRAPLPFLVSEVQQGRDLNGDGDVGELESVLHLVDPENGHVFNTRLAGIPARASPDGTLFPVGVRERDQGDRDLNGDGDRLDFVLHLVDATDETVTNLKLVGFHPRFAGNASRPDLLLVDVPEGQPRGSGLRKLSSASGAGDLNGDGDALDQVLLAFDLRTRRVSSTGVATGDSRGGFPGDTTGRGFVALRLDERGQGVDGNADGDLEDLVVQVFEARTRTVRNLGSAVFCCDLNLLGSFLEAHRDHLVLPVDEAGQGGVDLNGDGDVTDPVLHVHDVRRDVLVNHRLAVERLGMRRDGGLFAFRVQEAAQGGDDLNGDGDGSDFVLHVLDLRSF